MEWLLNYNGDGCYVETRLFSCRIYADIKHSQPDDIVYCAHICNRALHTLWMVDRIESIDEAKRRVAAEVRSLLMRELVELLPEEVKA